MLSVLSHAQIIFGAAFLASLVECVEALTVVLAVGSVRGWRSALAGAGAALLTLFCLVALLGSALARIPIARLQLVAGVLLLLFGLRWLRKAILRFSGHIPLHDEQAAFAKSTSELGMVGPQSSHTIDGLAFGTAFNITILEGVEVVFIILAISAGSPSALVPASLAALSALLLVVLLGALLHRPLARVPENLLKFVVGVLLSAFGTFWTGEGLHLLWPGDDLSLPALVLGYLLVALLAVALCRTPGRKAASARVSKGRTA